MSHAWCVDQLGLPRKQDIAITGKHMKTLMFTVSHHDLETLMGQRCLMRIHKIEDRHNIRDHYTVVARVRDEHVDQVIELSVERPRWLKGPEG